MVHLKRLVTIVLLAACLVSLPPASGSSVFARREPGGEAGSADTDTKPEVSPFARIAQTVARLRQVKVDGKEYEVPAAARPLLTRLKHQLRDLILAKLNQPGTEIVSLRSEIVGELNAAGVTVAEPSEDEPATQTEQGSAGPENPSKAESPSEPAASSRYVTPDHVYGDILGINMEQADAHPDLVAATTTVGVSCGQDTSLYVFQNTASGWNLILAQEANGYEDVSDGHGWLQYRISPPGPEGNYFIVAANVNPSCVSTWQSLRYQVMSPKDDPYSPDMILDDSQIIHLEPGPLFNLEAEIDSITLRFEGECRDPVTVIRPHVIKYRISQGAAKRIAPLVEGPEDFIDEWLDLSWEEASRWADAVASSELEHVHAALNSKEAYPYSEMLFVEPCADENSWCIGLDIISKPEDETEPGESQAELPNQLYFTIEKRNGAFFVKSVSSQPPPDCSDRARSSRK